MTPEMRRTLRRAGTAAKRSVLKRDEAIRQAVAEGGTLREVGAEVGMSHQAVQFIANGRTPRKAD